MISAANMPARPHTLRRASRGGRRRLPAGVVLLEVVLAVALFFGASLVIMAGLNSALRTGQRVQLEARAADLAVTLLSEIQMGLVPPADDGPNAYADDDSLADWTWEVVATPLEEQNLLVEVPPFLQVEVIIRNTQAGYTYRLSQLLPEEIGNAEQQEELQEQQQGQQEPYEPPAGGGGAP